MPNIYETTAARKDVVYRGWLTSVNYTLLMQTGAGMHQNSKMTPIRMRRWFLAGLTPYDAAQRLNRS